MVAQRDRELSKFCQYLLMSVNSDICGTYTHCYTLSLGRTYRNAKMFHQQNMSKQNKTSLWNTECSYVNASGAVSKVDFIETQEEHIFLRYA